ncbi:hypothetical protein, partial [Kosakonia oryziphila]|uniref:hypothetical protein n=1 Tax=Kosakonia oryziphila TaxID=1005667 RepID=UPI001ABEF4B6
GGRTGRLQNAALKFHGFYALRFSCLAYITPWNERDRYSIKNQCVKNGSGDVNGNSGRVNTDSGKMNRDSGHGAKSGYFPPEYAFT